ncbi:MAG: hypothetical protein JGK08_29225 [Microcoleus sp. PH2017_04_SCI_O_A]|uniref:hypothetical protein n=1 Tax=Microcoleus sp. PH2017_31_RDM_U_A TaxID=2798841 RepID=UPI001DE97BA4|nr:hypothetical protein [Microcoleus sp. PH2017_31_RDM_U_A]MCC3433891.1 hypothetical protein [Microcoleus sp. PH2017_04_SCI_O_A]MCC3595015.1 hypothetical protein [Microcoleus sp. PH2017_28_MFU_U_A]MCC3638058.1 hypothetical protein [Microcoleus sp. PH2017_37_MFU_D_B]
MRSHLVFFHGQGDRTLCVDALAPLFFTDRHRRLLEADNLDRASRSLKTNIKFSKEVCLPKN